MTPNYPLHLSRREKQVMDIVYRDEPVSAAEVQERLADDPSYSAVRAVLRSLAAKGLVVHKAEGARYLYRAKIKRTKARMTALANLVETFFSGAEDQLVSGLLELGDLSPEQLDRMAEIIEEARSQEEREGASRRRRGR